MVLHEVFTHIGSMRDAPAGNIDCSSYLELFWNPNTHTKQFLEAPKRAKHVITVELHCGTSVVEVSFVALGVMETSDVGSGPPFQGPGPSKSHGLLPDPLGDMIIKKGGSTNRGPQNRSQYIVILNIATPKKACDF